MGLVDTHCHLTYGELAEDPERAWQRAREAGVERAIVIGIDAASSPRMLKFVEAHDDLDAVVGIHPNEVGEAAPGDMAEITALAEHPKVVAIGESGLDAYWDRSPLALQQSYLERHIELAMRMDLPLVLHIRAAYPLAAEILEPHARDGLRGVIHCFGGAGHEADPFIDWGWPISFSGILTYGGARNIREAARRTPLSQCLVETDAPWLTPAPHRGQPNEPAFVVATARRLARVKGVSFDQISSITSANARRIFALG